MAEVEQNTQQRLLTNRESEVLTLVAQGLSNQQIADVLFISVNTVKEHLKNIFAKFEVKKRTMAVIRAREMGLLKNILPKTSTETAKGSLPFMVMPLIGREKELAEATNLLNQPDVRLMTIHGSGGTGKTHFALELAHRQRKHFADDAYFVSVGSLTSSVFLPSALAHALDYRFADQSNPIQSLLHYIKNKNILLVIDCFEHLLDGASFFGDILSSAPNIKIIVTSRARLNIFSEVIFRLDGIDFPEQAGGHDVAEHGAVQLFLRSAERTHHNFKPSPRDLQNIARICQVVQGIPLGILLATSWLDTLSTGDILAELEINSQALDSAMLDAIFQHQSLDYVFERSWQLLDTEQAEVLMKLAVFRNNFTREAATEIANATLSHLKVLVNKSMLQVDALTGTYYLHELFRQNAFTRLVDNDLADITHQAHFNYVKQCILDADNDQTLMPLIDDVRQALDWGITQKPAEEMFTICHKLSKFWSYAGYMQEGLDWISQILAIAENISDEKRAWALHDAGIFAFTLGEMELCRKYAEKSYALTKNLDNEDLRFKVILHLVNLETFETNYAKAEEIAQEMLAISREQENLLYVAQALTTLGITASEQQNYEQAIIYNEESLEIAEKIDDKKALSSISTNLGTLFLKLSDYEMADSYFKKALAIAYDIGNLLGQAIILANRSEVAFYQADYDKANQFGVDSLRISHQIGFKAGIAHQLEMLANIEAVHSKPEYATQLYGVAEVLRETINFPLSPREQKDYDNLVSIIREQMTAHDFEIAWQSGRETSLTDVLASLIDLER